MLRIAAFLAVLGTTAAGSAQAQPGSFFGDSPPRPPANIPNGSPPQQPPPVQYPGQPPQSRAPESPPPPSGVQAQPLPPPPGAASAPPQPPGAQRARIAPLPGAPQPPSDQPQPGGQPPPAGQLPQAADTAPPPPDNSVVTEMPTQKIENARAMFSGLDKITGRIISFDAAIGETVQFGALQVTARVCYTRPPTEATNTDAFVEVDEVTLQGEIKRIFNGWMFASSPGLHAVEHPIYDVWLTDCSAPVPVKVAEPVAQPTPTVVPRAPSQPRPARQAAPKPQAVPAVQAQPPQQPQ